MTDHENPKNWTKQYVNAHHSECLLYLREINVGVVNYIERQNYAAALAGFELILNGLEALRQTGETERLRSCIAAHACVAGEFMALVSPAAIENEMRDMGTRPNYQGKDMARHLRDAAVVNLENAQHFAKSSGMRDYAATLASELNSGVSAESIRRNHAPDFPKDVQDILLRLDDDFFVPEIMQYAPDRCVVLDKERLLFTQKLVGRSSSAPAGFGPVEMPADTSGKASPRSGSDSAFDAWTQANGWDEEDLENAYKKVKLRRNIYGILSIFPVFGVILLPFWLRAVFLTKAMRYRSMNVDFNIWTKIVLFLYGIPTFFIYPIVMGFIVKHTNWGMGLGDPRGRVLTIIVAGLLIVLLVRTLNIPEAVGSMFGGTKTPGSFTSGVMTSNPPDNPLNTEPGKGGTETPPTGYPTSGTCGDNVWWGYDENTQTLTIGGNGEMEDFFQDADGNLSTTAPWSVYADPFITKKPLRTVVIEYGVTSIGNNAFTWCFELANIEIPSSVTSIGDSAFHECTGLANITIPGNVTSIGDSAFSWCTSLTSIIIPNSVTRIGTGVFYECNSLTEVTIPDRVTSIESYTFYRCSGLTEVTIPDGVTSIGDEVFYDCCLTSITIPDSVTSIGKEAFEALFDLHDIYYTGTETQWAAIDIDDSNFFLLNFATIHYNSSASTPTPMSTPTPTFTPELTPIPEPTTPAYTASGTYGDNVWWHYDKGTQTLTIGGSGAMENNSGIVGAPWFVYAESIRATVIENGVTSIGEEAFSECTGLTSITIPNSVTSIGSFAFSNCDSLTSITIPTSVTSINYSAFSGCIGLTSITIPSNVTGIGDWTFYGCAGLTDVTISDGVTSIGENAFMDCNSLTSITIPNSVTSIESNAFRLCTGLTSVTIPNSVTSIGIFAFENCISLTDVYYTGTEEQWKAISISNNNDRLLNATIHYNSPG